MAVVPVILNDEKLINICIDQTQNLDISGRIYYCYESEPILFYSVGMFLRSIEQILDHRGFPMSTVRIRKFSGKKNQEEHCMQNETEAKKMDVEQVTAHKGAKGTFLVKIQCRQNATWQGNVVWGEKNCSQPFRSALELIKLIDSALDVCETDCTEKVDL